MTAGRFELHPSGTGSLRFVLKAGNGEVVATICAYGDVITLRQDTGALAGRQQVAARFDETFTKVDGTWKWIHSRKMDAGGDLASDCAVPEP